MEPADQLEHLRAMGCDEVQGYHFSRPVPSGEFAAFVQAALP